MAADCNKMDCGRTRRETLQVMVTGGMALVNLFLAGAEAQAVPQWVAAGKVEEFTVGVPKKVTLPGKQVVFVLRQEADKWTAISAVCTHKAAIVNWDADAKRYVCPAHGAMFNITGQDPQGPAPAPLATAAARLSGKDVQVDAEKLPMGRTRKKPANPAPPPAPK